MDYSQLSIEQRQQKIDYQKKYNQEHKEKVAEYQQLYYKKNKKNIQARLTKIKKTLTDEEKKIRLEKSRKYAQNWKNKLSDEEKEYYKRMQKKYREENREKLRNYRKNKPTIKRDLNDDSKKNDPNYFKCFCGKVVLKVNKTRHDETSGHIKYMERENMTCIVIE